MKPGRDYSTENREIAVALQTILQVKGSSCVLVFINRSSFTACLISTMKSIIQRRFTPMSTGKDNMATPKSQM